MDTLKIYELPDLHRPALLAAFAGWPDAAEAASRAVLYLVRKLGARKFAEIDPEEFYDFSQARPLTLMVGPRQRGLRWPPIEFYYSKATEGGRDLVLLATREPQLRWRTFTEAITELASRCGVEMLLGLGSLYDGVPHTGDVLLSGWATERRLQEALDRMGIPFTHYEGPSSIQSALMDACVRHGIPAVGLWGHAPYYITGVHNPKVSWGILSKVEHLLETTLDLEEIRAEGRAFEQQVDRALADRPDIREQIHRLEQRRAAHAESAAPSVPPSESISQEFPSPEAVVQELEDFLRRLRGENGTDKQ